MKSGTRIEFHGTPAFPGFPGVAPERATIARAVARWPNGDRMVGWYVVRFADGGRLLAHESSFTVIDNRAA